MHRTPPRLRSHSGAVRILRLCWDINVFVRKASKNRAGAVLSCG
jgi:hypothetical protein